MWFPFRPMLAGVTVSAACLLGACEASAQAPAGPPPIAPSTICDPPASMSSPCPPQPGMWIWRGGVWVPAPSIAPSPSAPPQALQPTPAFPPVSPTPGGEPGPMPGGETGPMPQTSPGLPPGLPTPGGEPGQATPPAGTPQPTPETQGAQPETQLTPSPAANQPAAAPELASAATSNVSELATAAPSMFGNIFSTQPTHNTVLFNTVHSPVASAFVKGPSAGELNLSDNGSPMPQDRIILDYDYFNHTPLAPGGIDVNRYTAGFEKTFFNGNCSFELRVPFATSLDNNVDMSESGLGRTDTHAEELGNVTLWTKGLLYRNQTCAISAGLGVQLPTAPDDSLSLPTGPGAAAPESLVYEVRNRSTHLLPFVGTVWTPTDRCFVQQFVQLDVDTVGNHVLENDGSDNLVSDGTLRDAPFLFYDISAGYWLFHEAPCSGKFLTGLAGIFELHYDQALERSNSVVISNAAISCSGWSADPSAPYTTSSGVQLGNDSAFSFVAVTAGFTAEIRDDAVLSVGYSVPLTGGIGREYNNQLQVYFSYYFGGSAKPYRVGPASVPAAL